MGRKENNGYRSGLINMCIGPRTARLRRMLAASVLPSGESLTVGESTDRQTDGRLDRCFTLTARRARRNKKRVEFVSV